MAELESVRLATLDRCCRSLHANVAQSIQTKNIYIYTIYIYVNIRALKVSRHISDCSEGNDKINLVFTFLSL